MTNVTRWDPFQDMLTLREAMNQLFEESVVSPNTSRRSQNFIPALDLSETPDAYIVEMAVPGMKAEDLEVTVENGVLTVKGEVKQEQQDKQRNYHRVERRFGSFTRTVGLPSRIKADNIHADLQDGVLRLDIPKAEEVKPRKISVAVNGTKTLEAANTPTNN